MSTQSLTNEIGGERRERDEGRKEGRLTVPCNEERGSSGGQKKDLWGQDPKEVGGWNKKFVTVDTSHLKLLLFNFQI